MPKEIRDKPDKPKRRLQRAFKWLGCGSIAVVVFLFWPVSPPATSLLARMPVDMAFGIEIRSGSTFWASSAGLRKQMAHSPLGTFLIPLCKQRGYEIESFCTGIDEQVNAVLDRPIGLGLVGRSLNGAVAVATTDTRFKDAALLAKLDNAGMTLMRCLLVTSGRSDQGLPSHLYEKEGDREWYITISHSLLVAATSADRLLNTLQHLESNERLFTTPVPPESVVIYSHPNEEFREATGRRTGVEAWFFNQGIMVLTGDSGGISITCNGMFNPERLRMTSPSKKTSTGIGFAPPEEATAWCAGYLEPRFSFDTFSHFLWEGPPERAVARPLTVLFWEALNDGIIRYADGTMLLAMLPPHPLQDDLTVPQMPEIRACWTITEAAVSRKVFDNRAGRIVDYYAAPGGSELYQMVREETKLFRQQEGKMEVTGVTLQPMFFNHLTPAWTYLTKEAEEYGVFTTARVHLGVPSIVTREESRKMIDVEFGWRMNQHFLDNCYAVAENKVADHGFAEKKDRALVMRKVGFLRSLLATFPDGRGTIKLEPDGKADIELMVGLPVGQ